MPDIAETVYRKFKPPFSERRYIAEPASMSIVGAISEICGFASVASGGAAVGNVRSVPDRAARSYSERAPPSARLGNGFRLLRLVNDGALRPFGAGWSKREPVGSDSVPFLYQKAIRLEKLANSRLFPADNVLQYRHKYGKRIVA
jgi:hypothetical protein